AVVLPAALSIGMNMFAEGAERNKALGLWGAIGASGATFGPITGGGRTPCAGWGKNFYLNTAAAAAGMMLPPRRGPHSRPAGGRGSARDSSRKAGCRVAAAVSTPSARSP